MEFTVFVIDVQNQNLSIQILIIILYLERNLIVYFSLFLQIINIKISNKYFMLSYHVYYHLLQNILSLPLSITICPYSQLCTALSQYSSVIRFSVNNKMLNLSFEIEYTRRNYGEKFTKDKCLLNFSWKECVVKEFTKNTHNFTEHVHSSLFCATKRDSFFYALLDFAFLSGSPFFLLCSSSVRFTAADSQRWLIFSLNETRGGTCAGCLTHVKEPHTRLKASINVSYGASLCVHVITPSDTSVSSDYLQFLYRFCIPWRAYFKQKLSTN